MAMLVEQVLVLHLVVVEDGVVLVETDKVPSAVVVEVLAELDIVEAVALVDHLLLLSVQNTQVVFPAQYLTLFLILY
jgi:hypothetical protein